MKWILIFLCLPAFGQLPVLPFAPSSAGIPECVQATYTVSSATLIGAYITCGSTSITNTADNSDITNWFSISASPNNLFYNPSINAAWRAPKLRKTIGPSGNPCVDFQYAAGVFAGSIMKSTSDFNASQPTTIIFAASITNAPVLNIDSESRQAIFDSSGTGRNLLAIGTPTSTAGVWSDGSALTPPTINNTNWIVWTVVNDGASSVIFTNGPSKTRGLFFSGNPGAGKLGQLWLGSDTTLSTAFWGRYVAILIYSGHMFTNDIDTISTTLHNQFSF